MGLLKTPLGTVLDKAHGSLVRWLASAMCP
jgi:hypothetical protein